SAAVKADTVLSSIVDNHSSVHVGVVDYSGVNPRDSRVVHESVVIPASADVPVAVIAVAIIDATIETDLGSPVTGVPNVVVAIIVPAPITGCPQKPRLRRKHPCARHPVVAIIITVGPIARSPNVAGLRTKRLLVDRQSRRPKSH